jgi:hypothetical protein
MIRDMPDELVEALVGHELAHCWMYAVGDHPPERRGGDGLAGRVLGLPGDRPPPLLHPRRVVRARPDSIHNREGKRQLSWKKFQLKQSGISKLF